MSEEKVNQAIIKVNDELMDGLDLKQEHVKRFVKGVNSGLKGINFTLVNGYISDGEDILSEMHIPQEVLEDSIEHDNLLDAIIRMFERRCAVDFEELAILGGTIKEDLFLECVSGLVVQACDGTIPNRGYTRLSSPYDVQMALDREKSKKRLSEVGHHPEYGYPVPNMIGGATLGIPTGAVNFKISDAIRVCVGKKYIDENWHLIISPSMRVKLEVDTTLPIIIEYHEEAVAV